MYCAKTPELESRSFHYKVAKCIDFERREFDDEIRRSPLDWGSNYRVGWFSTFFVALYLGNRAE